MRINPVTSQKEKEDTWPMDNFSAVGLVFHLIFNTKDHWSRKRLAVTESSLIGLPRDHSSRWMERLSFNTAPQGLLEIKNENIPWLTLKHFIATILFPWESMAKCLEVSGCLFFISYSISFWGIFFQRRPSDHLFFIFFDKWPLGYGRLSGVAGKENQKTPKRLWNNQWKGLCSRV